MKRESVTMRPATRCTSRMQVGDGMFITDWIRSGLASMPRCVTIKPRKLSDATPNENLVGLSFMLYF